MLFRQEQRGLPYRFQNLAQRMEGSSFAPRWCCKSDSVGVFSMPAAMISRAEAWTAIATLVTRDSTICIVMRCSWANRSPCMGRSKVSNNARLR